MRYSASSPQLLAWLDKWNVGKPYEQQIRPFGFMLSYTARTGIFTAAGKHQWSRHQLMSKPRKRHQAKPIAPYGRDPITAAETVFDRVTGAPVSAAQLKTYQEALAQYHLSCEDKFANGEFLDCDRAIRRHVVATQLVLIGKEANRIGESGETDPIVEATQVFGCKIP